MSEEKTEAMPRKNPTVYRAKFRDVKIEAFGTDQIVLWAPEIEVYQARVSPELWCSRPAGVLHRKPWQATSAEGLMALIEQCFVTVVEPWREIDLRPPAPLRPSLTSQRDRAGAKAG